MPAGPRDLGARLRHVRLDQPVRREREAALEPRMGGPVVALRRDHRTRRQGPLDRRRVARPERRHRPRGVRARAAAQRPVRVPQHRRQEDVDLQGTGAPPPTRSPRSSRRSSSDSCSCGRGRTRRSSSIRTGPTRCRACSTSSTSSRRRRPVVRSRARSRPGTRRRSGTRCSTRTRTLRPRRRCSGRHSRISRCSTRSRVSTWRPGSRRRRAAQLTEQEVAILRERVAAAHAWLKAYAPESARIAIQDELPAAAAELTDDMRRYLRAVAIAAETLPEYPGGAAVAEPPVRRGSRAGHADESSSSFAAIYLAFLGRDSGPRAGWLLASLDKDFVVRRLLEAADADASDDRRAGMSVGLQRLREDADTIRDGAIRKGEDPALIDRAIELDARTAPAPGRERGAQGRTQHGLEADRRGDQGRCRARRPRGRRPARRLHRGRRCASPSSTRRSRTPRRTSTTCSCASRTRPTPTSRSVARRPTSPSGCGASSCPTTSRSSARSAPTRRPVARPGPAGRTGSSARRSTSSTTPAARRSPARASRSTRAPGRRSSAASSTGSSTSTPARTG